jgi:Thioesterase-like superfamily
MPRRARRSTACPTSSGRPYISGRPAPSRVAEGTAGPFADGGAFFERVDGAFRATELTRGPWDDRFQHAGPPTALLGRELERCEPRAGALIARATFEIVRPIPIGELQPAARIVRPGRAVELLEGELLDDEGQELVRARAWRLRTEEIELSPAPDRTPAPPPGPEQGEASPFFDHAAPAGYHTAMEWRFVRGAFRELGPATVWMRMRGALVAAEPVSPLTRVLVAADSGNGVSAALDFYRHRFVNVDLSVHLHRLPRGEWVCLEATTTPQPSGVGLADTALWDERGPLGRSLQTLLVERRPD